MLHYPGFNPIAIEIGPIKVHWYGLMYLLGFGAAWALARRRAADPASTWKPNDVDDLGRAANAWHHATQGDPAVTNRL